MPSNHSASAPAVALASYHSSEGPPIDEGADAWKCGGVAFHYDVPTQWGSSTDLALLATLQLNAVVSAAILAVYLLLSRWRLMRRRVFGRFGGAGVVWAPRRWWHVVSGGYSIDSIVEDHDTLDMKMMMRYLVMMLHLFGGLGLFALPLCLPLYAYRPISDGARLELLLAANFGTPSDAARLLQFKSAAAVAPPPAPPISEELFNLTSNEYWSGLESMSVLHIPPRGTRFWAAVLVMYGLSALYLVLLRREWRAYVTLRHAWLAEARNQAFACLISISTRSAGVAISAAELEATLRYIFPGEVHRVLPIHRYSGGCDGDEGGCCGGRRRDGVHPEDVGWDVDGRSDGRRNGRSDGSGDGGGAPSVPFLDTYHLTLSEDSTYPVLMPRRVAPPAKAPPPARAKSAPEPSRPRKSDDMGGSNGGGSKGADGGKGYGTVTFVDNEATGGGELTRGARASEVLLQAEVRKLREELGMARASLAARVERLCGSAAREVAALLSYDEGGGSANFIAVFRTRRASALCAQSASLLPVELQGRTYPMPPPADTHWSNIAAPKGRRELSRLLATFLTAVLFLAWNIPVAMAQSMVDLDRLKTVAGPKVLRWLDTLPHSEQEQLELWLATLVLRVMQMVTLYSGILSWLSSMSGHKSCTAVGTSTLQKLFIFNFFLVLLASCVIGSLANTVTLIVHDGACALVRIVGDAVPHQASFFMSFLLQEALLVVPTFDVLMLAPLLCLPLDALERFVLRKLGRRASPLPVPCVSLCQKLHYEYLYARVLMAVGIGMVFACLAPLVIAFLLLWLLVVIPSWSHTLRHCLAPPQGASFDGGGAFWPIAVRLTTIILVTAQGVLVAILALNEMYVALVATLILLPATVARSRALSRYYSRQASVPSLNRCQELDAAAWRLAEAAKEMTPATHGGAPLPRQLAELLDTTMRQYEIFQRRGGPPPDHDSGDGEYDDDDDDDELLNNPDAKAEARAGWTVLASSGEGCLGCCGRRWNERRAALLPATLPPLPSFGRSRDATAGAPVAAERQPGDVDNGRGSRASEKGKALAAQREEKTERSRLLPL